MSVCAWIVSGILLVACLAAYWYFVRELIRGGRS